MKQQLRRYILPNILAMLGISCYLLADTFFISLAAGANGMMIGDYLTTSGAAFEADLTMMRTLGVKS